MEYENDYNYEPLIDWDYLPYNIEIVDEVSTITWYDTDEPDHVLDWTDDFSLTDEYARFGEVQAVASDAIGNNPYLHTITIPDVINYIGNGAFCNCENLTDIIISSSNEMLCSVDGVMYNKEQTSLLAVPPAKKGKFVIPDTVTSIADFAFANCKGLTEIIIPDSVTSISKSAFDGFNSLTDVKVSYKSKTYDASNIDTISDS